MKNKLLEASGEESNMDVTSESGSNTDVVTDTDDDNVEGTSSAKRRKLKPSERDLQMPLERGWKRETVIRGLGKTGVIKGDVSYYSPCGKTFRSSPDLVKVGLYVTYRATNRRRLERVIKLAIRAPVLGSLRCDSLELLVRVNIDLSGYLTLKLPVINNLFLSE